MPSDLIFEHPDWSLIQEPPENCESGWVNGNGLVIGLQHFGPDAPLRERLTDVTAARDHYRAGFAAQGMGLVQCDLLNLDRAQAVQAIGKIILKPRGAAYVGTIALPLPQESYVLNVAAQETGITGLRETAVMLKATTDLERQGYSLEPPPEVKAGQPPGAKLAIAWKNTQTGSVLRWAQDPYELDYEGPCLRNMADAPENDKRFAGHPLTQVRATLQCLVQSIKLSAHLKKRAGIQ
jgi:hypothetical protein